ncbi:sodium channel protein Nach-like isoform X1 [Diorhabda carinulata]|uniref:sodium channel protein Nach-like isoform X1 n=1 Tax=Diorhabda carinulata TaxID=1163345 RepID=UPI0025A07E93|nr:sodium channel protein Nach-like isoform X1 [Diorhabda carinulata]XP_057656688.1 sodium channel protein Nach-like isoform X1 [Diorhabda carinulata]XP_057656689.1 sodium channel protein Nach-like isoform X1 [Diorhabda carinulata]
MKLKTKPSRKHKSFFSVMSETFEDFVENTSIHGFKYIRKVGATEKIFWTIVLISGLFSAIYMTFLFWERYITNPTRTTIKTMYAPTTTIQFPAVTICNVNGILKDKLNIFLESLNIDEPDLPVIRDSFKQLLSFTDPSAVDYNKTQIDILQNVLDTHHYNVEYVMQKLTQNCSEMLKFCSWNGKQFDCPDLFQESLAVNGFCCSFNYMPNSELYTLYNGMNTGILAILNTTPYSEQYSSFNFQGFKVFIHDPMEYPVLQSITRMVTAGTVTYLQIYASKMTSSEAVAALPFTERNCAIPEERLLKNFPTYTSSNCLAECEASYYFRKCNCVPYYFNFIGPAQCSVSQIDCILEVRKAGLDSSEICDCPIQCEDDFYGVFSTQTKFEFNQIYDMQAYSNVDINHDTILLNAFFIEQTQTVYLRDTIFSTIYLLSSFGGVYSLFLGCSLITVIEVIYYATARLFINLKRFERASEETARRKTHIATLQFPKLDKSTTMDFTCTYVP